MTNRAVLCLLTLALVIAADVAWARGGGGHAMGRAGFPGFPLRFAFPFPQPSGIVSPLLRPPTTQPLFARPFVTPGFFAGTRVARATARTRPNPGVHFVAFSGTKSAADGFITVSSNTVPVSHGTIKFVEFNNVPQMSP